MTSKRRLVLLDGPCAGRRGCTRRDHLARGLCNACYKHFYSMRQLHRFPPARQVVSARRRYEDWVASGLRPGDYAREVGIPRTSLSRALRVERERLRRHGVPYLDGYRRLQVI